MRILSTTILGASLCVISFGCSSSSTPNPTPGTDPSVLAPPPSGQGFQMVTDDIKVAAGVEEQDCYFFKVSDLAKANGMDPAKPVNLHRIQAAQRKGSHHMNIFRVKTIVGLDPKNGAIQTGKDGVGECFKSPNWADWPLVANSQIDGSIDWTYPDGVANTFQPDEYLMLQTHWVNASTQKTDEYGKVRVNFWAIPDAEVKHQLGTLFATKQSIRVCQKNPKPVFEGSCQIKSETPVHIIGANGHFHSRGKQFQMYSWDGTSTTTPADTAKFYTSNTWDTPPMLTSPALDLTVPANAGVWYSCSYDWVPPEPAVGCDGLNAYDETKYKTPKEAQDCCYTFGPIVEKNEHCNIFVYYYPKVDNIACN